MMKLNNWEEHFIELKKCIIKSLMFFIIASLFSYYYVPDILKFLLRPLKGSIPSFTENKVIYTELTEMFLLYIKLCCYSGFFISLPFVTFQIYKFLSPGLYTNEKKNLIIFLIFIPILFVIGSFFVYYLIIPKAWKFFLSFEIQDTANINILLQAKITEYISLILKLIFAFGMAFQLPVVLLILKLLGIIEKENLVEGRRFAIVIIFIIAAILTPPDILSQFALAIPMMLLYEISILLCKLLDKGKKC